MYKQYYAWKGDKLLCLKLIIFFIFNLEVRVTNTYLSYDGIYILFYEEKNEITNACIINTYDIT